MSTRSTTHFIAGDSTPRAIVYRHTDGYPEGHGVDLQQFFADVEEQAPLDKRFNDPSYLAAKLIVWLASKFAPYQAPYDFPQDLRENWAAKHPLNFLSIGVVQEDPLDIEYRYTVDCSRFDENGRPTVTCYEVNGGYGGRPLSYVEVPIEAEVT